MTFVTLTFGFILVSSFLVHSFRLGRPVGHSLLFPLADLAVRRRLRGNAVDFVIEDFSWIRSIAAVSTTQPFSEGDQGSLSITASFICKLGPLPRAESERPVTPNCRHSLRHRIDVHNGTAK